MVDGWEKDPGSPPACPTPHEGTAEQHHPIVQEPQRVHATGSLSPESLEYLHLSEFKTTMRSQRRMVLGSNGEPHPTAHRSRSEVPVQSLQRKIAVALRLRSARKISFLHSGEWETLGGPTDRATAKSHSSKTRNTVVRRRGHTSKCCVLAPVVSKGYAHP